MYSSHGPRSVSSDFMLEYVQGSVEIYSLLARLACIICMHLLYRYSLLIEFVLPSEQGYRNGLSVHSYQ